MHNFLQPQHFYPQQRPPSRGTSRTPMGGPRVIVTPTACGNSRFDDVTDVSGIVGIDRHQTRVIANEDSVNSD